MKTEKIWFNLSLNSYRENMEIQQQQLYPMVTLFKLVISRTTRNSPLDVRVILVLVICTYSIIPFT